MSTIISDDEATAASEAMTAGPTRPAHLLSPLTARMRSVGRARDLALWQQHQQTLPQAPKPAPQQTASPVGFRGVMPVQLDATALVVLADLKSKGIRTVIWPQGTDKIVVGVDGARKRHRIAVLRTSEVEDAPWSEAGPRGLGLVIRANRALPGMLEFIVRQPRSNTIVRAAHAACAGGLAQCYEHTLAVLASANQRRADSRAAAGGPARPVDAELERLATVMEGAHLLSPAPLQARTLFSPFAGQLDNVAWVDFSEVRTFAEPVVRAQRGDAAIPGFTVFPAEMLSMYAQLSNDVDERRRYQTEFGDPLWAAVSSAVHDAAVDYLLRRHPQALVTDDPERGVVVATWSENDPFANPPAPRDKSETAPVKSVIEQLAANLAFADLADLADCYFSIASVSGAERWAARSLFFERVHNHFERDPTGAVPDGGFWMLPRIYGFDGVANDPQRPVRMAGLWQRLKTSLEAEFGVGTEDLSALDDAMAFKPAPVPSQHPFETFTEGEVNLGLRLVYRQEWRPLGIQRGEVVRTIPLGPKQSERVSTRITRRVKTLRSTEELRSSERSSETSEVHKDSSDIVSEAARSMKWDLNQDVDGGFNAGLWHVGGKTSFGMANESSQRNQETSTRLSEVMQKTANRIRTESKVMVSTESETLFEANSASDIVNPNDEIAITYVYSKLQTQYEVLTRLAELQSVVMVAEALPQPQEIGFEWVRRHDWILADALLDESFREALNGICRDTREPDLATVRDDLSNARQGALNALGDFAKNPGAVSADQVDFTGESQRAYNAVAREQVERLRAKYAVDAARDRLYRHLRASLLHYQRAIWRQEDPQQRMLRLRKAAKKVPLDWTFLPDMPATIPLMRWIDSLKTAQGLPGRYVPTPGGRTLPLVDLIDPSGPLGSYGNYALYALRPDFAAGSDLLRMLDVFKQPYVQQEGGDVVVVDPALRQIGDELKSQAVDVDAAVAAARAEMLDYVPSLRLAYLQAVAADEAVGVEPPGAAFMADVAHFRPLYPEYLFRKRFSRRFVVDNNNLIVDILPGEGSAVEPFKQAHRVLDVLKADEEKQRAQLENTRRRGLLDQHSYGDPDIEQVIVVDDAPARTTSGLTSAIGEG